MFWLRNKKIMLLVRTLNYRPVDNSLMAQRPDRSGLSKLQLLTREGIRGPKINFKNSL